MTLWLLFYEFAKTGLFAIGGGMATIPFLYAISEKTGWFTATDIGNMIAFPNQHRVRLALICLLM